MTSTSTSSGAGAPAVRYHLDFGNDPRGLPDRVLFQVYAYWLIGLSAGTIARATLTTRQKVLNAVTRGEYANRSGMPDQRRQALLDELKAIRFDDGRPLDGWELNGLDWRIRPLADGRKRRPRRKAVAS